MASGSLGLVTVAIGSSQPRPRHLDEQLGDRGRRDPILEPYLSFWEDRQADELIPTPELSYPTFHGSAADLAAIAAEAVNLIALNRRQDLRRPPIRAPSLRDQPQH